MKIAILVTTVAFMTSITVFAQKGIKDNFSDPEYTNTWISTESNESLNIWMHGQKYGPEDQYYGIEVLNDRDHFIELNAPGFPADADFLFYVKMTLQFAENQGDPYGVYFVGADGRQVRYMVSRNGAYRIASFNSNNEKLTDYQESKPDWIRPDYNIFKIEKMGDGLNLIISGEQIGGGELVGFPIVKFGFLISKKMIVYIDDIYFDQVQTEQKEKKKKLNEIPAHLSKIDNMSISSDGKVLVTSANNDKDVFVWNAEDGQLLIQTYGKNAVITKDGKYFALNFWQDCIVYETATNKEVFKVHIIPDLYYKPFFSIDNTKLIVCSDKTIDYYDLADGKLLKSIKNPEGKMYADFIVD